MPQPSATHTIDVGSGGKLQIGIAQISQNLEGNTSQVQVFGAIENNSSEYVIHAAADIICDISGSQDYVGPDFSFNLKPGDSTVFIDHIFTIIHDGTGNSTPAFTVFYGTTGVDVFGDNHAVDATLTLTRIPQPPSSPGTPTFSNVTPTTVTVSWTPSSDDGGSPITAYITRQYKGPSASGDHLDNFSQSLTRNFTGLIPGAEYTFTVYATNLSHINDGDSPQSGPATLNPVGGPVRVRSAGTWKLAIPYVRDEGVWKMAIPFVRDEGLWQLTE
jgi:Fibronectin type III domain